MSITVENVRDDAAEYFEWRLPELFGSNERRDKNIIPYPVACSPQLWSVGAEFVVSKILKEAITV